MTTVISAALRRRDSLDLSYTHVDDFYIDGAWVTASGTKHNPVVDPATGQEWSSVPKADQAELDRAVAAARRALPDWNDLTAAKRAEVLALTSTRENGSPHLRNPRCCRECSRYLPVLRHPGAVPG